MNPTELETLLNAAAGADILARSGVLAGNAGEMAIANGINLRPRELVSVLDPGGKPLAAQCVRMAGAQAYLSFLDRGTFAIGAKVASTGELASAPFGMSLLGRVIDGLGRPLDTLGPLPPTRRVPINNEPPNPLDREPISLAMETGVRAIDGFLTLGRGQRVGIFAGSGVGKSTLLGMLARGTKADITVIALIGERGREVRDFIEHDLGLDALKNCVVVASTGDNPAAMRLAASNTATAIAEAFRAEGKDVLLLFDSLTRVAMAQREIGLASGEPPTTKGYPPSVFSLLPHLMERAGPSLNGSITAIYTVLVDGEDMDEPIADLARATLDGHIVLRRTLASAGHYPPIDVLQSVSRLASRVCTKRHTEAARQMRLLMAAHEDAKDLISIGAYVKGADPTVDAAMAMMPSITQYLRQAADEVTPFEQSSLVLRSLAGDNQPGEEADAIDGEAVEAPESLS